MARPPKAHRASATTRKALLGDSTINKKWKNRVGEKSKRQIKKEKPSSLGKTKAGLGD